MENTDLIEVCCGVLTGLTVGHIIIPCYYSIFFKSLMSKNQSLMMNFVH